MQKYFIFLIVILTSLSSFPQTGIQAVTVVVHGSGSSEQEAKLDGLRSAIEQTFGTFISSQTDIVNDIMINDDIHSVTHGNIESYKVLSREQLPDGKWGMVLEATVSVTKLKSFIESKGHEVNIKGGLFALNIKQQLMNEEGEVVALTEMVGMLHELMQGAFDFTLHTGSPVTVEGNSTLYDIPMTAVVKPNSNFNYCMSYMLKTLRSLSLSKSELQDYLNLKKEVIPIAIQVNPEKVEEFFFRTRQSGAVLAQFFNLFNFYTRLFKVDSGLDQKVPIMKYVQTEKQKGVLEKLGLSPTWDDFFKLNFEAAKSGPGVLAKYPRDPEYLDPFFRHFSSEAPYHNLWYEDIADKIPYINLSFIRLGRQFTWNDRRTLDEINQLEGYKILPLGVVSKFKHGGFVLYEKDGKGLVLSILGQYALQKPGIRSNKSLVEKKINKVNANGFTDWRLPTRSEIGAIMINCDISDADEHVEDLYQIENILSNFPIYYYWLNLPWQELCYSCSQSNTAIFENNPYKLRYWMKYVRNQRHDLGFTDYFQNLSNMGNEMTFSIAGKASYHDNALQDLEKAQHTYGHWTYLVRSF